MSTDSLKQCETSWITADCTVDAVIARSPAATSILNASNIDTCCGGRASLGEAALQAHVDLSALIALLAAAPSTAAASDDTAPRAKSCGCGCR